MQEIQDRASYGDRAVIRLQSHECISDAPGRTWHIGHAPHIRVCMSMLGATDDNTTEQMAC